MHPWATGGLCSCSRWGQQGAPSHEVLGLRQESPHGNQAPSLLTQTCSSCHETCRAVLSDKGGYFLFKS